MRIEEKGDWQDTPKERRRMEPYQTRSESGLQNQRACTENAVTTVRLEDARGVAGGQRKGARDVSKI